MAKTIDLGGRLKAAFGFVAANVSAELQKRNFARTNGITNAGVYVSDASFEELTLRKDNNEKLFFGSTLTVDGGQEVFAPPPMISYRKSKNLIITEIDGTDAEVVERYGDKSWQLRIQGVLIDSQNHRYPKQQLIKLREFFDVNASFSVECEMFDDLGIKNIYFTDVEIAGVAGYEDTLQYTLEARSIKPVEFFFVKNNN